MSKTVLCCHLPEDRKHQSNIKKRNKKKTKLQLGCSFIKQTKYFFSNELKVTVSQWWLNEYEMRNLLPPPSRYLTPFRSTIWWFCLQTGPMWRTPAGCKNMRTSSRRKSRSFTTSTPLAPRSVSMRTRKGPGFMPALPLCPPLYSRRPSLCRPLPSEADGTSGPCHLWCHWGVIRQCGLEGTSHKPLQS